MFGLKTSDIDLIIEVLRRHSDVEEAIIYGSRAMGNYKPGSDIDLVLKGNLKPETSSEIAVELNERLPLPYKFDVTAYSTLSHQPLIEHIDRYGKVLYKHSMQNPQRNHSPYYHLKWGIVFILLAWLSFTLMATVSRIATSSVPVSTVIFFQNFISWLTVVPWVFLHGVHSLKTKRIGLIVVRSIGGLLAFAFLFLAVQRTSLVDAVLLNNTAPLIVPFAVWIWLKIPINHKLWPGIIAGFLGIIFILKPGREILNPGALYALGAAVCLSIVMIAVRRLSYTERHHTVLFYYFAIASMFCFPLTVIFWKALNGVQWFEILSIGLLSAFGQWCFMRAFHHAKPSQLGPFCYMAVVYSGIIEWILWGKIPDIFAWIGILLVCAGGIWTIRFSKPVPKIPTTE